MTDQVRIRMFGGFSIFVRGQCCDQIVAKSKKGIALLQYLIMEHTAPVPSHTLIQALWPKQESSNPESALKTLISRLRSILNQCNPGLGGCILATRGGYQFHRVEGLLVDLLDFEDLAKSLEVCGTLTVETDAQYQKVLSLYTGDLLAGSAQEDWAISRSVPLHGQYITLVYAYLDLLKAAGRQEEIIQGCRFALENDPFDQRLHLELMQALVKTNRNNEALMQYKHVTHMHFRYLGVDPPQGIQEFYQQIIRSSDTLDMNLDAIRCELQEFGEVQGASECDYPVFRQIFNLQMRNLERLGVSMCIGIIMISTLDGEPLSPLRLDEIMKGLGQMLREHLHKGDTFTHFSPSQYAMLLPAASEESGRMVLERVKGRFYQRFPSSNLTFSYRVGPMSSHAAERRALAETV